MVLIFEYYNWFDHTKLLIPKEDFVILLDKSYQIDKSLKSIFIQLEPEAIIPQERLLIENYNNYTYILTFNQKVLDNCPNAKKYIYGTSRMSPEEYNSINISKKIFELSFVAGDKLMTIGHFFRRAILNNRQLFTNIPLNFFITYGSTFLGEKIPDDIKE